MSFVVYDVETTGLNKRFDQIVQFAAVLTDTDLNVKDRIETWLPADAPRHPLAEGNARLPGFG